MHILFILRRISPRLRARPSPISPTLRVPFASQGEKLASSAVQQATPILDGALKETTKQITSVVDVETVSKVASPAVGVVTKAGASAVDLVLSSPPVQVRRKRVTARAAEWAIPR